MTNPSIGSPSSSSSPPAATGMPTVWTRACSEGPSWDPSASSPAGSPSCDAGAGSGPSNHGSSFPRRRQKRSNAASYGSRSSRRRTNTAAPAQRTCSRSPMSTRVSARVKSITAPRSTLNPAVRRLRAKTMAWRSSRSPSTSTGPVADSAHPTACPTRSSATGGHLGEERRRGLTADPSDILLVLEDDAQGLVDERGAELACPERQEGSGPVESLGHPGYLRQVGLPQAVDERDHLGGQPLRRGRHACQDDLQLPVPAGIVDPVVQATTLQGVVDLACPVGGEDDARRDLRPDRPDLRHRDLEVGQDLEEIRLELLVGSIDLVDEED